MTTEHATRLPQRPSRAPVAPGWVELLTGGAVYAAALAAGIWWIDSVPPEASALRGHLGYLVSGATGILALAAAVLVRLRSLTPFGFRRVGPRWVVVGVVTGVAVYYVNQVVALAYIGLFGNDSPQGDYQSAAAGGLVSLAVTLVLGAGLTGLGEEVFFRGVVANVLWRYGAWAGVVVSAVVFALVHGVNLIFPLALVVGVVNAVLLRRSGSVWPCVLVHVVYNGISNVGFMLVA